MEDRIGQKSMSICVYLNGTITGWQLSAVRGRGCDQMWGGWGQEFSVRNQVCVLQARLEVDSLSYLQGEYKGKDGRHEEIAIKGRKV